MIFCQKHQKMKISQRVLPIDFCQKTLKNEDFVKDTPYEFLLKSTKTWKISKCVLPYYEFCHKTFRFQPEPFLNIGAVLKIWPLCRNFFFVVCFFLLHKPEAFFHANRCHELSHSPIQLDALSIMKNSAVACSFTLVFCTSQSDKKSLIRHHHHQMPFFGRIIMLLLVKMKKKLDFY